MASLRTGESSQRQNMAPYPLISAMGGIPGRTSPPAMPAAAALDPIRQIAGKKSLPVDHGCSNIHGSWAVIILSLLATCISVLRR